MSTKRGTAPRVMPGEAESPAVREDVTLLRKANLAPDVLAAGVIARDRVSIGRALSLLESTAGRHQAERRELLALLAPHAGRSFRLGISGAPGVGKSTFIEALGMHAIEASATRVAVLAIDPSSEITGGSILGDKTRMTRLAMHTDAMVRPSASGSWLGGVARASRESILVCEAAGFNLVIVETVGVGQSDTQAASMVDFFLLLMMPGAGDELQGIKRGILEIADGIAINKADGESLPAARKAMSQLRASLHLIAPRANAPSPQVVLCSAKEGTGIESLWGNLRAWMAESVRLGRRDAKRREQSVFWMNQTIEYLVRERFANTPGIDGARANAERRVMEGALSPFDAATQLVDLAFRESGKEQ